MLHVVCRVKGDFIVSKRNRLFDRILGVSGSQEADVESDGTGQESEDCASRGQLSRERNSERDIN